jgi:hypothetical protein
MTGDVKDHVFPLLSDGSRSRRELTIWHGFAGTELPFPSGSTARSAPVREDPIRIIEGGARENRADS